PEALTRPKIQRARGKVAFSQPSPYFTWRTGKQELIDYFRELASPAWADAVRPNLWPNTPDIFPEFLQRGGPAAFRIRLVLAAMLGASWGLYSGFELCYRTVLQGEEYRDSAKYPLVRWRTRVGRDPRPLGRPLNALRAEEVALQRDDGLDFFDCDDEQVLFFGKRPADGTSQALVAVSLDPYQPHSTTLTLPLERYG